MGQPIVDRVPGTSPIVMKPDVMIKGHRVPHSLSCTVVGLPDALLGMLTFADFDPVPGGVNITLIAQAPLGATAVVQVLPVIENDGWFVPVSVGVPTVSDVVPVLFTVIACTTLDVPTA